MPPPGPIRRLDNKKKVTDSQSVTEAGWPQWRGPNRDGITAWLPGTLPENPEPNWVMDLPSEGIGGLSATKDWVVVGSREFSDTSDIFTCHAATDGREIWRVVYPALGDLDYGNSPRATPLVVGDKVVLAGAFGNVTVVNLADGKVCWEKNLKFEFGAAVPIWGFCGSPLAVEVKPQGQAKQVLVLQPGTEKAALVGLDLNSGEVLWKTKGQQPGYSSLIVGEFGGVHQIVGYDKTRICGWDPQQGTELWSHTPDFDGDFNVPTPINLDGKLFLTTENNGSRLFGFDEAGKLLPEPLAVNQDLAPDTHTPVRVGRYLCGLGDRLYCLSQSDLKTVDSISNDDVAVYGSVISDGKSRMLIATLEGKLLLVELKQQQLKLVSEVQIFDGEIMAHPAMVGKSHLELPIQVREERVVEI